MSEATPESEPLDLSRLRDLGRSSGRTALLWAAALTIVWLSGLEPTCSDLVARFADLQANHRALQRLDRRLTSPSSQEILYRESQLATLTERQGVAPPDQQDALSLEIAALQHSQRSAKAEQQRLANLRESLQQERVARKAALRDLRQKRRQVTFDILGQRFEVPPFYAPIVWNAFMVGLLLYLLVRRNTILVLSTEALATAGPSVAAARRAVLAEFPWWLAPLPSNLSLCASPAWHLASLAVVTGLGLMGLAQTRVSWVGLEISRWLASGHERALLALVLSLFLFATANIVSRWLLPGRTPTGRWRLVTWVLLLLFIVFTTATVFASSGRQTYRFAQGVQDSLPSLALLLGLGVTVFALVARKSDRDKGDKIVRGLTRRQVLTALGIILVGLLGTRWLRRPSLHPRVRPRFMRRSVSKSSLPAGFYWNPSSGIIHHIHTNGRGPCDHSLKAGKVVRLHLGNSQVDDLLANAIDGWHQEAQPAGPLAVSLPSTESPHIRVHEACAGCFFEEAALAPLRGKRIKGFDVDRSLSRLVQAVRYEAIHHPWRPNYRLYDLLAALAIRSGRYDRFQELEEAIARGQAKLKLIESQQPVPVSEWSIPLQRRDEQWNRIDSSWNRRIESEKPWRWGSHDNGVVF